MGTRSSGRARAAGTGIRAGTEVAQTVLADVTNRRIVERRLAQQVARRLREQDLAGVCRGADACRPACGRTFLCGRLSRMDADPDRASRGSLDTDRGSDSVSRPGEGHEQRLLALLDLRSEPEQIPGSACLDPLGSEPLAQRVDVPVKRRPRSDGRPFAPQRIDELIAPDDLAGAQQQQAQDRPLLWPNGREVDPVGVDSSLPSSRNSTLRRSRSTSSCWWLRGARRVRSRRTPGWTSEPSTGTSHGPGASSSRSPSFTGA